jgi:hypothetical protein
MGRSSMLLVMGLAVIFGIIGNNVRKGTNSLTETHSSYYKYTNARNLARLGIHRHLRYLDGISGVSLPHDPMECSYNGGSYSIDTLRCGDTLTITSRGTYQDTTYTSKARLLYSTKPFPTSKSAIGVRATPVNFSISGGAEVDGRNYDATGTTLVGSGDLPGVTTMNATDSATVKAAGGSNIVGNPAVKVDQTTTDPGPFIEEYKNSADYIYSSSGTYSGATWGSAANPTVVYCNSGDDTTFSIKFTGGVTGYGILVVRGNVQFNGNFSFYGLVVVDGFNTQVQFGASGTPQIVGGLCVAGNAGAKVTLKGSGANSKVKYSAQALTQAKHISKLMYYSVLDWYE